MSAGENPLPRRPGLLAIRKFSIDVHPEKREIR
jgi:hypothetical protein